MAAPMFCAGGAEFDDDDDDDGFILDGYTSSYNKNTSALINAKTPNSQSLGNGFSNQKSENSRSFGGFGAPPNRKKTTDRSRCRPNQSSNISLQDSDFQMAIMRGQIDVIQKFIKEGGNVNLVLKSGWTGAMYAANVANSAILKLLLDSGAKCNYHKEQYTVMMAACGAASKPEPDVLACVEMLLAKGADVNAYDRYHTTSLMYAAREGRALVIDKLVKAGINVNKQDNRGWTALTWAVSKNHPAAVRALMLVKADPQMKHTDGQTVVDMAYSSGLDEMLELLEGKKRERQEPLAGAADLSTTANSVEAVSSSESTGTKYGELELFLCGLDLSQLIPVFHAHHVNFTTLLRMSDEDLSKMGISQLGFRKKILDGIHAVHKKDWEKSSLPSLNYKKQISCAEALAVIANISKHTMYINTTIGYLGDQVKKNPAIVDELQDGTGCKQLLQHAGDTIKNVENLHKQLRQLQAQLNKDMVATDPPDFVKYVPIRKTNRYRRLVFMLSGGAVGLIIWKRQLVWQHLAQLMSPSGG